MRARLLTLFAALLLLAGPGRTAQPPAPEAQPQPPHPPIAAPIVTQRVQAVIQTRIPASGDPPRLDIGGLGFSASPGLPCFYERRGYTPAWSRDGALLPQAAALATALAAAGDDGLRPEDYHLAEILRRMSLLPAPGIPPAPGDLAELDLILTDAFLLYAVHLYFGQVNPETVYDDCVADFAEMDFPATLQDALAADQIRPALANLAPPHAGYRQLRQALAKLREATAKGGWPTVPTGPTLRPGEREAVRIPALRARLAVSDGVAEAPADPPKEPDLFDPALQEALRTFQRRHGLEPDGVAGAATVRALNVPVEERARQIEANMERWRWLPRDLGERHLMVNIAGFELDLVEAGTPTLSSKVVVGKPYTRTPMFSGTMTYLVLNPTWSVPRSIFTKELLPKVRNNPAFLAKNDYEVVSVGGRVVDPSTIDWATASGAGLTLRQKPGKGNALGRVKFMFPNRFNVYLHDTPSRSGFERTVRTFSHGCIRLEKPVELAEILLKDDPAWNRAAIDAALATGRERRVSLARPVPVHLVYWTVWVDQEGVVQWRDDVYERDDTLYEALEAEAG